MCHLGIKNISIIRKIKIKNTESLNNSNSIKIVKIRKLLSSHFHHVKLVIKIQCIFKARNLCMLTVITMGNKIKVDKLIKIVKIRKVKLKNNNKIKIYLMVQ